MKDGIPDEQSLLNSIRNLVCMDPNIVEAGIAFIPFAYNSKIRLFGKAVHVDDSELKSIDLDSVWNFTKPGVDGQYYQHSSSTQSKSGN